MLYHAICSTPDAGKRLIEFFTSNIHNPNTRKVHAWAVGKFVTLVPDKLKSGN
jgi:hypothetical protein